MGVSFGPSAAILPHPLTARQDYTQASNLLSYARTIDPTFQTTREGKFLNTLTDAFSQGDVEVCNSFLSMLHYVHLYGEYPQLMPYRRCLPMLWWNGIIYLNSITGRPVSYWPQNRSCNPMNQMIGDSFTYMVIDLYDRSINRQREIIDSDSYVRIMMSIRISVINPPRFSVKKGATFYN